MHTGNLLIHRSVSVVLPHQAAEFRQFWGSRSELRRFQDGEITEAVLWDGKSMTQKRLVPKQIVAHLLQLYVLSHTTSCW